MNCPSCGTITDDTTYCNNCKTSPDLYKKVHMMASRLYNKGLKQAQGRYLSGAIESLSACLRIQKHHIDARNLLGLIYWEIGEVGQAIKQWVISSSYQKEENIAKKYLNYIQNNPTKLEEYADSIHLYNTALHYILQGSEDIGIISLKRAISKNPKHITAKCLLSLHYMKNNQEDKAKSLLREIFKINRDHPKTIKYWSELSSTPPLDGDEKLNAKKTSVKNRLQSKSPQITPLGAKKVENMIRPKSLQGTIMAFVFGAICMLGVYGVLIAPSKTANLEEQLRQAKSVEADLEGKLQIIIREKEENIQKLERDNKELAKTNEALQKKQMINEQIQALQNAKNLQKDRAWIEAADILYTINKENLEEESRLEYENLIKEVYPKAGEQLYQMGYNQYQRKNYAEAKELLEKSYLYAKEEYFSDNALYIIGRSYEAEENIDKAKQYYQSVIEQFPNSDSAYNAKRRLPQ